MVKPPRMMLHWVFVLALSVQSVLSEFPLEPENRIESDFTPENYKVDLKFVKLFTERYPTRFSGTVTITLKCCKNIMDTRYIKLHSKKRYGLKIKERAITVRVGGGWVISGKNMEVEKISYDITEDILVIKMNEPLETGTYEVFLKFDGKISEDNGYVVYYSDKDPNELGVKGMSYLVATNSERQNAFPCIDEPDGRAKIQVTAAVSHGEGTATVNTFPQPFRGEIKFPPSQVAFVVTNLEMKTPITVKFNNYWTGMFHQRSCAETNPSTIPGRESMVKGESEFMTSTVVPQVAFWVIPTKQEIKSFKWGLAIISEREIDEDSEDKRLYNYYIRFTRMIFGGLISTDRWEADEYFAALAEYLARLQVSMEEVNKLITVRWERPSGDIDDIMEKGLDNFEAGISDRNKGLLLFRMVHHFSDDDLFLPDMIRATNAIQHKSVKLDRLFEEFKGKLSDEGITTWVDYMHKYFDQPGYPVITATPAGKGKFKFVQEPFVGSIKERMANYFQCDSSGKFRIWPIPISYQVIDVDKGSTVETEWNMWMFFSKRTYNEPSYDRKTILDTEANDGHVVVFNVQCVGVYRVRYEDEYWEKIVHLLKSNRKLLHPTTRACIVHDAFSLAWAGYQDYEKALSLLPFLRTEDDDIVWHSFFYAATDVADVLEFSRETYVQFQIYIKSLLMAIFNSKYASNIYFQRMNEGNEKKINTVDAFYMHWACYVTRIAECVRQAKAIVDVWLKAGINKQQLLKSKGDIKDYRSLLRTAFCTVLTEKMDTLELVSIADFMRSLMSLSIQNQAYRDAFIEAVRCVPNIFKIVESFLEMACTDEETPISNAMTLEDKQNVFVNLARGKDSYLEVFTYMKEHLNDKIIPYHKSYEFVGRVISTLTARMTTAEVAQMDQFIKETYMLNGNRVIKKAFEEGKAANARRQKWLEINDLKIRNAIKTKFCVTEACDF